MFSAYHLYVSVAAAPVFPMNGTHRPSRQGYTAKVATPPLPI